MARYDEGTHLLGTIAGPDGLGRLNTGQPPTPSTKREFTKAVRDQLAATPPDRLSGRRAAYATALGVLPPHNLLGGH